MHSFQDIEEIKFLGNGGTNSHIYKTAQCCLEDNPAEFLQGPHRIVIPQKNLVLMRILRSTMENLWVANGLLGS